MFTRPNKGDNQYAIADFLEIECVKSGSGVSALSYRSLFSVSDDEIDNEGIDSSDDLSVNLLDNAICECSNRRQLCPNRYPFLTGQGSLELIHGANWYKDVYIFLLLATRLDMNRQRVQAEFDGTQLFERLCALVVKEYYGAHAQVQIFGTSLRGSFHDKVENLIQSLHIKGHFKAPEGSTGRQKDGSLDIVAWIPFADNKDSQMIALGQCKTGTNWESKLSELDSAIFFSCYSSQQPYSKPLKMFFVADSFGNYKWEERCSSGGIFFDRTRIMEYLPIEMDDILLNNIRAWNEAALNEIGE